MIIFFVRKLGIRVVFVCYVLKLSGMSSGVSMLLIIVKKFLFIGMLSLDGLV